MGRGVDQLSDWIVVEDAGSKELRLHLRCTNDVATQIERRLSGVIARRLPYRLADQGEWTHRYALTRALDETEVAFFEMLTRLLTLRLGEGLLVALALD